MYSVRMLMKNLQKSLNFTFLLKIIEIKNTACLDIF